MLIDGYNRYITLRQSLGYKVRDEKRQLKIFTNFLTSRSETHITSENAAEWANLALSPYARDRRMHLIVLLAKFLKAEDSRHVIPSRELFKHRYERPLPFIYSKKEIELLMLEANKLRRQPNVNPIRPEVFVTFLGLIASTGMRISEALKLRVSDIKPNGVLHIRDSKFNKSRYVPLHTTVLAQVESYLKIRSAVATLAHDHLFIGFKGLRLSEKMAGWTFLQILRRTNIGINHKTKPRIHDLRHTFATRSLEQCQNDRTSINKHLVALSTYLGHVDIKSTYWYLESTPELMSQLANEAENFIVNGGVR